MYFVARYRKDGAYVIYNTTNSTLTFYNGDIYDFLPRLSASTTAFALNDGDNSPRWISDSSFRNSILHVQFGTSFNSAHPTSMKKWFALPNITSISGLDNLTTGDVTNMDSLFYENSSLPYIDVSSFDMGSVSTKNQMFAVEGDAEKILIYLPTGKKESDFTGYSSGQFHDSYNIVETTDGTSYTCSNYRIFDGYNITVPTKPFTATTATFEREFTENSRSTVFLPFAFDTRAYGKVYSFSGELMPDNAGIRFNLMPEGTTVANTPYIIDPDGTMITATNVNVVATQATTITEDNQMVGVYERCYVPLNAYCYDASNGKLKRVAAENGVTIKAGRAYFHITNEVAAKANVLNAIFNDDVTGIDKTFADDWNDDSQSAFYTLDGQKLNGKPTRNGIYIHNGKKEVIK